MNIAIANQFTKEAIKSRMMQHAANLWGVRNTASLDPFVRLLIEAFSTEIYRAANETQNIEGRILDKIARMLTPNLLTIPRPAHGIMQALPADAKLLMHPYTKFTTQKRIINDLGGSIKNEEIQVSFSPAGFTHLVKGKVAFIANSYQLFSIDASGFKHPLMRTNTPLPWATCFVGLKLDKGVKNLANVSIYFDFPSFESSAWIYQLLALSNVTYNGSKVAITAGQPQMQTAETDLGKDIFRDYDLMEKLNGEIISQYAHKFITLKDCPIDHKAEGYPAEILQQFPEAQLAGKVPKNIVWLKIEFPPNYNYEILSNCYMAINAFPALNRNLITNLYSYKGLNNILPLRTEAHERFMTVHKVTDASGREYHEIPYNKASGRQTGFYSIRQGGVERFDQRSAQDMVNYLLELTRDEVAAFSSLDQTFIRTSLEGLAKQLKQIQNKSNLIDKFIKQAPSYLVIEPVDDEENVQVEYWVTNGIEANQIRTGTEFRCHNSPDVAPQGNILLSETVGGREQLQLGEHLDACRYALGSRNRLITQEDIRSYCKVEIGKKIKDITFSKGLQLSPHPTQGYIRTLDIHIVPANYQELDEKEWNHIANGLLVKIKSLSPDGVNYRIFIDK